MVLGTKFKENAITDISELTESIINDITVYIDYLLNKFIITPHEKIALLQSVETYIETRITTELQKPTPTQTIFKVDKEKLQYIYNTYIITPTDKVPGNYSIICKKLFTMMIARECGIHIDSGNLRIEGNQTYKPTILSREDILHKHESLTTGYLHKTLQSDHLPIIFATPKMHKNPPGFRFIVAAKNSSLKQLELECKNFLSHYTLHFKNYCNTIKMNTGHERYIAVTDSQTIVTSLKYSNSLQQFFSGDFTALFPTLHHRTIQEGVNNIVDLCHKNAKTDYLFIDKDRIRYTTDLTKKNLWHKNDIKNLCKDILSSSFMTFASVDFITTRGTPQGSPISCDSASLALSWAEYKWLSVNPLKKGQKLFRYVDDLLAVNIPNTMQLAKEMYPSELTLNDTTVNNSEVNFLDLNMQIHQNRLLCKVYNKTDDYTFQITRYFHSTSNMPARMPYGVLEGQILRYIRLSTKMDDLWIRIKGIFTEYQNKGFSVTQITKSLIHALHNHEHKLLDIEPNVSRRQTIQNIIRMCAVHK